MPFVQFQADSKNFYTSTK